MIYLDNSATTKPCQEAIEAVTKALTEGWANPSALYEFGIDAARSMRDARTAVAKAMGAEIAVKSFHIFEKGEGIEKRADDFAAEIEKMVKG